MEFHMELCLKIWNFNLKGDTIITYLKPEQITKARMNTDVSVFMRACYILPVAGVEPANYSL